MLDGPNLQLTYPIGTLDVEDERMTIAEILHCHQQ